MSAALALALWLAAMPADGGTSEAPARTRPRRQLSEVTLLYFHATWCGSCRRFDEAKVVPRALEKFPGLTLRKIDIDQSPAEVERYGVTHTPSLVLVDSTGFPLSTITIELDAPDATLARLEKTVRKMAATSSP